MSGFAGREALFQKNSATIAGVRTKSMSWSGEPIDVTSTEDSGKRTLLALSGQEQIDITFDGVTKSGIFRTTALSSATKMLTDITIVFPAAGTLSGNFRLSAYEDGLPYNDAATFSGTLNSSGSWTWTPVT